MVEEDYKQCSKCMRLKPIDEFRYLVAQGRYQSACLDCERSYARERRSKLQKRGKQPKQTGEVLDKKRAYAVRAILNYIDKYGEEIIKDAKKQRKRALRAQEKDAR